MDDGIYSCIVITKCWRKYFNIRCKLSPVYVRQNWSIFKTISYNLLIIISYFVAISHHAHTHTLIFTHIYCALFYVRSAPLSPTSNISSINSPLSQTAPGVLSRIAKFMGPTWVSPGSRRPRWAPCWPHESCYQGRGEALCTVSVGIQALSKLEHLYILAILNCAIHLPHYGVKMVYIKMRTIQ